VAFAGEDATTQGTWQGTYGARGYRLAAIGGDAAGYARVEVTSVTPVELQRRLKWYEDRTGQRAEVVA
jgi:hypothetical protein